MVSIVVYDASWMGFLTAVFEIYEYKISAPFIVKKEEANLSLFGQEHVITANTTKANRVLVKLKDKLSLKGFRQIYVNFLSETKEVENYLFRYIQYVLNNSGKVENNFAHPDVVYLQQLSRKVEREKHRMEAFVRFQLTGDRIYYAIIQPDYNVLPLITPHFKNRYADQKWLIYDALRKYGIYYDLEQVTEIQMNFSSDVQQAQPNENILNESEHLYQTLWQQYFSSVNIRARKNTKLHVQHMPKRYWKYLVEKQ